MRPYSGRPCRSLGVGGGSAPWFMRHAATVLKAWCAASQAACGALCATRDPPEKSHLRRGRKGGTCLVRSGAQFFM